jgi:hypothetical protein
MDGMKPTDTYNIKFSVNGLLMYSRTFVASATLADNDESRIFKGININSATATVTI